MEYGNKCCFTGYRPNKFPFVLEDGSKEANEFDNLLFGKICELATNGITTFFSGMAMGFDIIAAECVLDLKKLRPDLDIKLICAIPFINQVDSFSENWKKRYEKILSLADKVVLISDSYYKGCYMARNEYMVDNSDVVLTYFDGLKGGTKNTLQYAKKVGRAILNISD